MASNGQSDAEDRLANPSARSLKAQHPTHYHGLRRSHRSAKRLETQMGLINRPCAARKRRRERKLQ